MSARLASLKHKHKAAVAKMREISTAAGDSPLSEDQEKDFTAAKAEADRLTGAITAEQALVDAERAAAEATPAVPPTAATDRTPVLISREERPKFTNIAEHFAAVRAAYVDGKIDHRLFGAAGASEGVAPDGGFLVQLDLAQQIIEPLYEPGSIVSRCTPFPLSGNSNGIKIPAVDETSRQTGSRYGGIRGYWLGEDVTATATKMKFAMVELSLKRAGVLAYATDDLLADAPAFAPMLLRACQSEVQFTVEDSILNGDGSGKPRGIIGGPSTVAQAIEATQTIANSGQFIALNTSKMISRLPPRSFGSAVWLANIELLPTIVTATVSGTAGTVPVYVPPGAMKEAPWGLLWGRPVLFIEYCSAPGTVGDLILSDLAMYGLATKGGVQIAESMHVRFLTDEMTFRILMRIDGAPLWKSAVTPHKGSLTRSPFITLAARP